MSILIIDFSDNTMTWGSQYLYSFIFALQKFNVSLLVLFIGNKTYSLLCKGVLIKNFN